MNSQSWIRMVLIILAVLLLVAGVVFGILALIRRFQPSEGKTMVQRIELQTADGVTVIGDVYQPTGSPRGGVLLLHMMPADRTSWKAVATRLADEGYRALAIDLRGHGESTHQGDQLLNYQEFSDAQHQASRLDVQAAMHWLTTEGDLQIHQIGFMGASIGANLALLGLEEYEPTTWAVLLSPGLSYRGIEILPSLQRLTPPKRLYLAASTDDLYSYQSVGTLQTVATLPVTTKILTNAGHAMSMLEREPNLTEEIITWISRNGSASTQTEN